MKKWFVFYTKSRQEKKVYNLLVRRNFEVFLPLQKVMRQWSDRKKKVEVPLFHSYLFVFDREDRIPEILATPGIAWNIKQDGKPAVLHPREYELIKRFLETGLLIEISMDKLEEGDWVEVADGPLKGAVGQVTKKNPGRFTVLLEAIGQVMRINLDPHLLKKHTY